MAEPSEQAAEASARTVRVTLADAPTDVLMLLASHPRSSFNLAAIAGEAAPLDADNALVSTGIALRLLQSAGYVQRVGQTHWRVTDEGRTAVREAVQEASRSASPQPDENGPSGVAS